MKTKMIPALVMLIAGAVASIIMFFMHYDLHKFLWILLGILLFFYILGCILKYALDKFGMQIEKEKMEFEFPMLQNVEDENGETDGSVIKKR